MKVREHTPAGRRLAGLLGALALSALLAALPLRAAGAETGALELEAGTYPVQASLSCYVNAMGGVEFGAPLLEGAELTVAEDGAASLTLYLGKSSVTIYSVTCDTFVDADPASTSEFRGVENGTLGYYDGDGVLHTEDVTYTLSQDTALNPRDEAVAYVDSITFPVTELAEEIHLTMYINSNVMGVQFCDENDAAEAATYPCTLTVDWSGLTGGTPEGTGEAGTGQDGTASEGETEAATSEVVEMDGLNVHYAGGGETEGESGGGDAAWSLAVNRPAFLICLAAGCSFAAAGAALIIAGLIRGGRGKVRDETE